MSNMFYLFFLLLLLSAFFSGAETAFLTTQNAKAFVWNRQGKLFSKLLLRYIHEPEKYLITVLIGNNLVNIAFSAVGTILFITHFNQDEAIIIIVIIVLFFSEITPKIISSIIADSIILKIVPVIRFFEFILYPMNIIARFFSKKILKNHIPSQLADAFSEHEITHIFSESQESGHVELIEHQYIKNIFLLNHTKVKEIMTPRTDIIGIKKESTIKDVAHFFAQGGYSKLPIYDKSIDKINGLVFAIDLLSAPNSLNEITKPALFIPETKYCKDLLIELRKEKKTIAIAIDEFGGVSGLVSIENILEVIVGNIKDEVDNVSAKQEIIRINEQIFKVSGQVEKELISEQIGITLIDGDYETIAGMILNHLERLPKQNEKVEFENYSVKILNIKKNRIEWILIKLNTIT